MVQGLVVVTATDEAAELTEGVVPGGDLPCWSVHSWKLNTEHPSPSRSLLGSAIWVGHLLSALHPSPWEGAPHSLLLFVRVLLCLLTCWRLAWDLSSFPMDLSKIFCLKSSSSLEEFSFDFLMGVGDEGRPMFLFFIPWILNFMEF